MLQPTVSSASHDPVLGDPSSIETLRGEMLRRVRSRRLGLADADDVVQTALTSYLEVGHRYPSEQRTAVLFGILRNKCREHTGRSMREARKLRRYCAAPEAALENAWIQPPPAHGRTGVLEELARTEDQLQILGAIDQLRPGSRRIVTLIVTHGMDRQGLIAHFGVNENTMDSRLRACRIELRELLRSESH